MAAWSSLGVGEQEVRRVQDPDWYRPGPFLRPDLIHNHQYGLCLADCPAYPYTRGDHMTEFTEPTATNAVFDTAQIDAEAAAKIAEAIERVRPLDRDQKDNLLDILREDSRAIERQVLRAFGAAREAKQEEVLAQFPEPESQVDRFRIEAEQLFKAQVKEFRRLAKKAQKEGVIIKHPFVSLFGNSEVGDIARHHMHVSQSHDYSERDKALAEALAPINKAETAAVRAIHEAREGADRKIRLASVSKDASDILGTLPDPAALIGKIEEAVAAATTEIEAAGKQPRRVLLRAPRPRAGR